jgi:hypothetical protein
MSLWQMEKLRLGSLMQTNCFAEIKFTRNEKFNSRGAFTCKTTIEKFSILNFKKRFHFYNDGAFFIVAENV